MAAWDESCFDEATEESYRCDAVAVV